MQKLDTQYAINQHLEELHSMNILIASNMSTKSKKGHIAYTKIRNKLLLNIEELKIDETQLTVFQKIKKSKKDNTLFSRLKYLNKDK